MLGGIGAQIVLLSWIPVTLLLFMVVPPRRAIVIGSIAGWLILPPIGISLPGVPDYTKTSAITLSILLGIIVFDAVRLTTFRPRWFDIPMIVYCVSPFCSSISNDLGPYDGLSAMATQCVEWLLPYWIGRIYITDVKSYRELGLGMIIGGVCLIPFCLLEFKMSAITQQLVYGLGDNWEGVRMGGYRPKVFFSSGLALGLWMNATTLVAWWFQRTVQFKRLGDVPAGLVTTALLIISILCRATGATVLLAIGFVAMVICLRTRKKWAMWCVVGIAPLYCAVRSTELWSGQSAVVLAQMTVGEERACSLDFRLENEDLLIAKALQRPIFGWGGWGRNRVYDEMGNDMAITDGYWIILFGTGGYVGLSSITVSMLLPAVLFLKRFSVEQWNRPELAAVTVFGVILNLFLIDCLVNAMPNIIYVIVAGGLFNIVLPRKGTRIPGRENDSHMRITRSWETLAAQYRARGRIFKDRGRAVEAKTAWQHGLDLMTKLTEAQPDNPVFHQRWCDCANDLAWLLVNTPELALRDPDHALSLALKTTERYPTCNIYWNTLAACYYRKGDYKAANAALDRSVTLGDGGAAFDYILLTMIQAQLGNQEQAYRWFAETMHLMEQNRSEHPELRRLCDEAGSLLNALPEASAIVP